MQDKLIFESDNFSLFSVGRPHVSREEGGHLKISPKVRYADRLELSPELATEMAWLEMLAGQAMTTALRDRGIDLGIINYQDNKNWGVFKPEGPYLHVHLYGRAKDAKVQKYGDAISAPHRETGCYDNFESLNDEDIAAIQKEINRLLETDKFKKEKWCLK
jgi:diadenosine tetraphosphate (Ap4A) HIT family hydrolase